MIRRIAKLSLAAVAVAATFLTASAGARSLDQIISAGSIRIGINPNFPNMSVRDDSGNWKGFDIDIGNAIAKAIGVKVEWVPTEAAQRVPFLVSDRIDMSLGALTRNADRAKLISYTVPLHTEVMAVLTTDKAKGDNWKDFDKKGVTLADMRGNWTVDWIKQNMPNASLALTDTIADTVRLVAQGRADAIVENIDFFMAFTKNYPDVKWRVLNDTINVSYDCIGVSKDNNDLLRELNIVLYDLHSSGEVNADWEKNYGAPMLVKVVPNPYF